GRERGRKHEQRDDLVREQKSGRADDEKRQRAPRRAAPAHPATRRNRAANAPSTPCLCGSTRSRPASSTDPGTTPSAGGSSRQSGFSARKRSTCASFSSGSSEHVP